MKKNVPDIWDDLWKLLNIEDFEIFQKEEYSIRWQRVEQIIIKRYHSFKNLRVIEIGAGLATYSALMAKRGAKVTIVDYSKEAIDKSRMIFKKFGLTAEFIRCNALHLPKKYLNKYDVSMSFGLTEHFFGENRFLINKMHFDVLTNRGITFISVPNKYNFPYRIWKYILEKNNNWIYGEEYPYIREYFFIGDSLIASLNFLSMFNPWIYIKKRLIKYFNFQFGANKKISIKKKERGTFLDQYFSYALVLCAIKHE